MQCSPPQQTRRGRVLGVAAPGLNFVIFLTVATLAACGSPILDGIGPGKGGRGTTSTADLNYYWQPFTKDSVWNLKLSPTRNEVPIPAGAMATGPMDPSDADYGIKVYFARPTDPVWQVQFGGFNSFTGTGSPNPASIRGPADMAPPNGSDGTVILIDENLNYAYEMLQFAPQGGGGYGATSSYVEKVDLNSNGIYKNVGVSAAGLPGIAGLLKSYETKNNVVIKHKMWVAAHYDVLYAGAVWPANSWDVGSDGPQAFLKFGDVVALTKNLNVASNECNLSPFIQRIARALQDYGGIVEDSGGDSIGFISEVNSIRDYIDVDYNSTMWDQFACLKKYMVKVTNPWDGATPGGLGGGGGGGGGSGDTMKPTVPTGLAGSAPSQGQVQLHWQAATDNVGVAGYRVFRNGSAVAVTAGGVLQYTDGNLAAGTSYGYSVSAYDAAGNESAQSAAITVTTPGGGGGGGGGSPELLKNPGFEGGLANWRAELWDGSGISAGAATDRSHAGGQAARIAIADNQSDGAVAQTAIKVQAGKSYALSAWMSIAGYRDGQAGLMIDWFGNNGQYLSTSTSAGRSSNTGWATEQLTAAAPAGATRADISLYSWAIGSVYFDDVSFKQVQ